MAAEVHLRLIGTPGGVRALAQSFEERLGAAVSHPHRAHDPALERRYIDLDAEQVGSLLLALAPRAYGVEGFLAALTVAAEEWLERDGGVEMLRAVLTRYLHEHRAEYARQVRGRSSGAAEVIAKPPESDP